jgi:hypothetical protein
MKTQLDLRGLEPPEPMMRIMETLSSAVPGSTIEARLERRPMFLLEELGRRGQSHVCAAHPDVGWILSMVVGRNTPS